MTGAGWAVSTVGAGFVSGAGVSGLVSVGGGVAGATSAGIVATGAVSEAAGAALVSEAIVAAAPGSTGVIIGAGLVSAGGGVAGTVSAGVVRNGRSGRCFRSRRCSVGFRSGCRCRCRNRCLGCWNCCRGRRNCCLGCRSRCRGRRNCCFGCRNCCRGRWSCCFSGDSFGCGLVWLHLHSAGRSDHNGWCLGLWRIQFLHFSFQSLARGGLNRSVLRVDGNETRANADRANCGQQLENLHNAFSTPISPRMQQLSQS